jgi:hypothetical protein
MNYDDSTIRSVSTVAAQLAQAWAAVLMRRVREGGVEERIAATMLLRDLANGELPELPQSLKTRILACITTSCAAETQAMVRRVMETEIAALNRGPTRKAIHFTPSTN